MGKYWGRSGRGRAAIASCSFWDCGLQSAAGKAVPTPLARHSISKWAQRMCAAAQLQRWRGKHAPAGAAPFTRLASIQTHGARLQNPGHVLRIMWCVCVCVCACVCVFSVWCVSLAGMGTRSGCGAQRTADQGALPSTKARAPSMSTSRSVCTCEHKVGPGVGHIMRRRVILL